MVLGDAAVGMSIRGRLGYITIGRWSKVTLIDTNNFKQVGEIIKILYHNSIEFTNNHNEKAYITTIL